MDGDGVRSWYLFLNHLSVRVFVLVCWDSLIIGGFTPRALLCSLFSSFVFSRFCLFLFPISYIFYFFSSMVLDGVYIRVLSVFFLFFIASGVFVS